MGFFSDKRFEVLKENTGKFFSDNKVLPQIDDKCCNQKKDRQDNNTDRYFRNRVTIGKNVKDCDC